MEEHEFWMVAVRTPDPEGYGPVISNIASKEEAFATARDFNEMVPGEPCNDFFARRDFDGSFDKPEGIDHTL